MANSQTHSLLPHTQPSASRTPLLAHRQSKMNFRPPSLHPPTTPIPAAPSYTPSYCPTLQCPAPILKCHAEIVADEPAAPDPPAYASVGPQPPTSLAAPPAYIAPPAIIALRLWRLEHQLSLVPEGTCYLQTSGCSRKNKIRLGTRIICLDFRGWGLDEADRVRVAVRNWGEIGGRTIVQFATVPATAGVVKDDDTFFISFFPGFVSEEGWGEEKSEDRPWFARVFGKLLSKFRS